MAYCPECLTEYESWATECLDCHVPLSAGSPPNRSAPAHRDAGASHLDLVSVHTFMGAVASLYAALAKNILEAEGIPCVLMGETMARIIPLHNPVTVHVARENASRAVELLDEYFDNSSEPPVVSEPTET